MMFNVPNTLHVNKPSIQPCWRVRISEISFNVKELNLMEVVSCKIDSKHQNGYLPNNIGEN
jgi:hypothetical protein